MTSLAGSASSLSGWYSGFVSVPAAPAAPASFYSLPITSLGDLEVESLPLSFSTEPIVGWRVWRIVRFQHRSGDLTFRLASLSPGAHGVSLPWTPMQRMDAACLLRPHFAPWPTCHCGVWALRDEQAAVAKANLSSSYDPRRAYAVGQVSLWGRVLEGKNGYRGQYAYPKHLIVRDHPDIAAGLADEYGIPADVYEPAADSKPSLDGRLVNARWNRVGTIALDYACGCQFTHSDGAIYRIRSQTPSASLLESLQASELGVCPCHPRGGDASPIQASAPSQARCRLAATHYHLPADSYILRYDCGYETRHTGAAVDFLGGACVLLKTHLGVCPLHR